MIHAVIEDMMVPDSASNDMVHGTGSINSGLGGMNIRHQIRVGL